MVVGATVGDLCEIGNASILMSGARVDDRVFLGEGTLEPAYRVDLQIGAHALVADEPATAGGGDLGPTPIAPLLSALTRHPARHTHHHDLPDRLRRDR